MMPGGDLVDRDAGLEVGALGRLGVHARQERAADAAVAAGGLAEPRHRGFVVQVGQHDHAVAELADRLEDRG